VQHPQRERVIPEQLLEVVTSDRHELTLLRRPRRRRTRSVVEERHLAEPFTLPAHRELVCALQDLDRPRIHDVVRVTGVSLLEERLARLHLLAAHDRGHATQVLVGESREEVHLLEQGHDFVDGPGWRIAHGAASVL